MSFFVTLEGIEGSGKSTLQQGLVRHFSLRGSKVISTREPGATEIGKRIRSILLESSTEHISPLTELLLFSADRIQHIENIIRPALDSDALVICDRFYHSTLAYQGGGREMDVKLLESINSLVTKGLRPDLVLLMDLPVEVGLKRAEKRKGENATSWGRFEEQEISFHKRVRDEFLKMASLEKDIFFILDAARSPEEILANAIEAIEKRL